MQIDLYLLHAPSVYDFRRSPAIFGPLSDVIPSSTAFEMYPVGLTSIADHLERNGYRVQIMNVAYRMLNEPHFDVEKALRPLRPRLFGIDLHWLPHAHGSLEIARILKELHPDIPIVFGGLSSSYYAEELMQSPYVDFVMRGDSTEEPTRLLVRALRQAQTDFSTIPNLAWRDQEGTSHLNPITYVPDNLDGPAVPGYRYAVRSVLRYGNLKNVIPYKGWLQYPTTALLTVRGCTQGCIGCGGSRRAYDQICSRQRPAFRSPASLMEDLRIIRSFSRSPIFVIGDIRQAGHSYADEFLRLLKEDPPENELVFELFYPGDEDFFRKIEATGIRYSLELTLESHDEAIRKFNGKFPVSNEAAEETIRAAFNHSCQKLDIFFMVGLPYQTKESVLADVDYAESLMQQFAGDKRLTFFMAPLAPFVDPGSKAFEEPEKYGYRLFYRTLEEHRQALLQPSWKYMLNYETRWMTRDDIVDATYDGALALNELKFRWGYIDEATYKSVAQRVRTARQLMQRIDEIMQVEDEEERQALLHALQEGEGRVLASVNKWSVCGEGELTWPVRKFYAPARKAAGLVADVVGDIFRLPHSAR